MSKKKNIYMSKYNDLSKIYDISNNKLFKTIPIPNSYYNSKYNKLMSIVYLRTVKSYSLLGLNYDNIHDDLNKKSTLIKLRSGVIALRIPYTKLFKLYNDDNND